jgi:hypothetical protein
LIVFGADRLFAVTDNVAANEPAAVGTNVTSTVRAWHRQ